MEFEISAIYLIAFVVTLAYVTIITGLTIGWYRIPGSAQVESLPNVSVSIVVPVRNEGKNIKGCLSGLMAQDYPHQLFEIIVVDDHSEDLTYRTAVEISLISENVKVIVLPLTQTEGKKAAIQQAMEFANGSLVLCTDADCFHPRTWVRSMSDHYKSEDSVFISGPVLLNAHGSLPGLFQELEFISLVASGAGAIGINTPLMCNGANLGFSAEAYRRLSNDAMRSGVSSGDDVFLMLSMKKKYGSERISFVKNKSAVVMADAAGTISGFISQRLRWVSKSRAYRDSCLIITAITVFLMSATILSLAFTGIFSRVYLWLSLALFIIKILVDFPLIAAFTGFVGKKHLMVFFPIIQLMVVLFTVFAAIAGNLVNVSWKGRGIRR
ncbi:MAG: glycosyltransferase [Bacteroidota bacterium]